MLEHASWKIQVFCTPFFAGCEFAMVILGISSWALSWRSGASSSTHMGFWCPGKDLSLQMGSIRDVALVLLGGQFCGCGGLRSRARNQGKEPQVFVNAPVWTLPQTVQTALPTISGGSLFVELFLSLISDFRVRVCACLVPPETTTHAGCCDPGWHWSW